MAGSMLKILLSCECGETVVVDMKNAYSASELLANSLLYQELHAEHEEVLRHKWLESERVGHDIGYDRALFDWNLKHRSGWVRHRRAQRGNRVSWPSSR